MKIRRPLANRIRFLFLICILSIPLSSYAGTGSQIEYSKFFAEYENIFLFRPQLVREIFFSIADLKGNKSSSRKNINNQVMGCYANAGISQSCRIEKLQIERKKQGIPVDLVLPVNFTRLSARNYNKRKKRLTLQWNPELVQPPSISVDAFLRYITAARESKYYKIKPGIDKLQINTLLERKIDIIVENELAANLLELYKKPRLDFEDSITFAFDFLSTSKRFNIIDCSIQFRAIKVDINHQVFRTTQQKR